MVKRPKITIAGAGNVGATLAHLAILKRLGNVVLVDIAEGIPQGKALDMQEAAPVEAISEHITGTNDYQDTANSDMIVVTAGMARKPGMTRDDLLDKNMKVMRDVIRQITPLSPDAYLIIVTNPSDIMAQIALKESGFAPEKVIGLGGVLDSARFRTFIAQELGVSYKDVTAFVLGGHGDDMVPLVRYSYAGGIPISTLLSAETLDQLVHRTRFGGGEIVNLLKTGSAFYAPGSSIITMMESILLDEKRIMPVSAYVNGEYDFNGLFLGVPVILGSNGVEKILEIDLTAEEKIGLMRSAEGVKNILTTI
jgi:malate dehydrogenase